MIETRLLNRIGIPALFTNNSEKDLFLHIHNLLFSVAFGYSEFASTSYTGISPFHGETAYWYFQGLVQSPAKPLPGFFSIWSVYCAADADSAFACDNLATTSFVWEFTPLHPNVTTLDAVRYPDVSVFRSPPTIFDVSQPSLRMTVWH